MHEGHSNIDNSVFKLEKYVRDFPWLYYNVIEAGYKCKFCKMFLSVIGAGGNTASKFSRETVKSLTDHPRRFLSGHQTSSKHANAIKAYEGENTGFQKFLLKREES